MLGPNLRIRSKKNRVTLQLAQHGQCAARLAFYKMAAHMNLGYLRPQILKLSRYFCV